MRVIVFLVCAYLLLAATGFWLFLICAAGLFFSLRGLIRLARPSPKRRS